MIEKEDNEKEKVLEMSIDELELSVRSYNCLKRAGINTVEELCNKTSDDMMKVRNLEPQVTGGGTCETQRAGTAAPAYRGIIMSTVRGDTSRTDNWITGSGCQSMPYVRAHRPETEQCTAVPAAWTVRPMASMSKTGAACPGFV